jgi:hypothetical protein
VCVGVPHVTLGRHSIAIGQRGSACGGVAWRSCVFEVPC